MKCPKCESENTQRLEVALHGGTQNISTSSNTVGIGGGGKIGGAFTKTSGQSQSVLAAACAAPAKKSYKWPAISVLLGVFPTVMVGASGIASGLGSSFIGALPFIGIGGYLLYSRYQFNSKKWPSMYQHWRESWICHKCGVIYHQA
jgi:hypothetical protein